MKQYALFALVFLVSACSFQGISTGSSLAHEISLAEQTLKKVKNSDYHERTVLSLQALDDLRQSGIENAVTSFLIRRISLENDDPYVSWYEFLLAQEFEKEKKLRMAIFYYKKVLNSSKVLEVNGSDIRYQSIQAIINYETDPYERVNLYKTLIESYASKIDLGLTWYYLARSYETAGWFDDSFKAYKEYLSYPGTQVPGKPNEEQRVSEMLDIAKTSKRWTRRSLDELIKEIRASLASKDGRRLLSLQTGVHFFSMSWLQEKVDFNSQPNYNLRRFLETSKWVYTASELEPISNSREAYLRTWGWNPYISTWYLYFRRLEFPADPEVHGNWEWAGIYFGEYRQ